MRHMLSKDLLSQQVEQPWNGEEAKSGTVSCHDAERGRQLFQLVPRYIRSWAGEHIASDSSLLLPVGLSLALFSFSLSLSAPDRP